MRVTEIFWSLQGEASRGGLPTAFVRLTGCPLRCRWCDTAYAFHGGRDLSIDQVLHEIERVSGARARHACVTGGEPLAAPECPELVRALLKSGYDVAVETSGALDIDRVDRRAARIVDFKCPASGEEKQNDYGNLSRLTSGDEIKFVIADRADFTWAEALSRDHDLARRFTTWASPVHGECDPRDLAAWILASDQPLRQGFQLHKWIWGADARGV